MTAPFNFRQFRLRRPLISAILLALLMFAGEVSAQPGVRFAAAKRIVKGSGHVAVGDINGDGQVDLVTSDVVVIADVISSSVSVLLGKGKGKFRRTTGNAVNGGGPVLADFNRDGKVDLSVLSGDSVSVMPGLGDGTFGPKTDFGTLKHPYSMVAADVTGDGNPDLVISNPFDVSVMPGNGAGGFGAPVESELAWPAYNTLLAADVNHDGRADVIVTHFDGSVGSVSVSMGNADGTLQVGQPFDIHGRQPVSITAADLDGDGNIDLVTANEYSKPSMVNGNVSVLMGHGDGTFRFSGNFGTGETPQSVAAADLDSNGKMDLVTANYSSSVGGLYGTVSVLLGKGDGSFRRKRNFSAKPLFPGFVVPADVNRDGRPDLIVTNRDAEGNIMLLMNKLTR